MSGTLAQTIQGEASDTAGQFAVATTIWNRKRAGTFPGGSDASAIVNAPSQYVGYAATPSATANALADAIENGTLDHFGTIGNAVNFQSGATAAANGLTGGVNIGGNWFSDQFGAPTANFTPPALGTNQIADAPIIDHATGLPASLTDVAGASSGKLKLKPGKGNEINVGLQPSLVGDIQSWISQIAKG